MPFAEFTIDLDSEPLVATAVHAGHELRADIARSLMVDESDRSREEDPYTDEFTSAAPNRVVVMRSRFEVDLNRPRDEAVYLDKHQAWGLHLYDELPSEETIAASLELYDRFYLRLGEMLDEIVKRQGGVVVLDLHAYNHRREGTPADPAENPDVNVGTGSLDRARWGALVDGFLANLRSAGLDARENVKFKGRALARFVHDRYRENGCCLAVEFKKTFVDEWTGEIDRESQHRLIEALGSTARDLMEELGRVIGRDLVGAE